MKLKKIKIRKIILLSYVIFIGILILLLIFMQILLFNKFYEIYQRKNIEAVSSEIKKNNNLTNEFLEDLVYESGICISVYKKNSSQLISTIYNKGCIFSNKKRNWNYIYDFINSKKTEDTDIIENERYKNKTIIKAIKYDENRYIFLNTSIEPLESYNNLLKSQYIYILIILFIISTIFAYLLSKIISKPITKLSKSAINFANGNYDSNFEDTSKIYEIEDLRKVLKIAENEFKKTDELRRDLMANVGHDLKTPLTMIKAYAEMSRDLDKQTLEKRKENMNIIIEESDRLNILVDDILDLSKLQSKVYVLKMENFDICLLTKNILKRYSFLKENEKYEFIYNSDCDEIIINADKKRIEQVIYNLINNAINYTGSNKKVFINLKKIDNVLRFEVKDTGKGINKDDIKYIWNKYYHNEKKHKRNTIGTGLGLSIVKLILDSHSYNYGIDSSSKGTTFYFEIEINNN